MMWWWGGDGVGAAGWIGMALMVVFWVAVVVAIVFFVRSLVRGSWGRGEDHSGSGYQEPGRASGGPQPWRGYPEALRILEERYARGEIDREEYLQKKADLTGGAPPAG